MHCKIIKREVSDGVIAPGYTEEALAILKEKRKGSYNVIEIDPSYVPQEIEHKDVFGVTFEQGRNEPEDRQRAVQQYRFPKQRTARKRKDRPAHFPHCS